MPMDFRLILAGIIAANLICVCAWYVQTNHDIYPFSFSTFSKFYTSIHSDIFEGSITLSMVICTRYINLAQMTRCRFPQRR